MRSSHAARMVALLVLASPLAASAAALVDLEQDDAGSGLDAPDRFEDGLRLPAGTYRGAILSLPLAEARDPLLDDQDDAGSGGDAPGDFEHALPLSFGTYEGRLAALPAGDVDVVTDQDDWYRFQVAAGEDVTLALEALEPLAVGALVAELRRPDLALAAWVAAGADAPVGEASLRIDASGSWGLRIRAAGSTGGAYRFTVLGEPPQLAGLAFAGPGYVAVSLDVGEGGRADVEFVVTTSADGGAWRRDLFVLKGERIVRWISDTRPAIAQAEARAEGVRIDVRAQLTDLLLETAIPRVGLSRPGSYLMVQMTHAPDVYATVRVLSLDGAELRGLASGGGSSFFALRPADFQGVAAAPGPLEAVDGKAAVDVSSFLLGTYACPLGVATCSVARPGGAAEEAAFAFLADAAPGRWAFTRSGAGAGLDGFPLFAADVAVPR